LIQDRRGQGLGVEVEGEGALFSETGEEELTAASHFLGGGGAEHLVDVFGAGLGDEVDFRLGHGDKKQDMTAEELDGTVDDLRAHGGFGEVGDPEDKGATGLEAIEDGGGAKVVSLAGFGASLGEELDELAEVSGAATGEETLLDGLAVGEKADAIAGVEGKLGEGDGGGAGVVQL